MDTSCALIAQAVAGDRDALCSLLVEYAPTVARAVNINTQWRSVLEVEDVMQVTFIEAFLQIGSLAAKDEDGFVRWFDRIAQNNVRDALRGLKREKRPQPNKQVQQAVGADSYVGLLELLGGATSTPSRQAAQREVGCCIDRALLQLPPDYRTVIQLYDLEGCSGPDVARRLDRSRGAVHMLRARALDRLRQVIGQESQFFSDVA